jgi:hypothetical protein
MPVTSWKSLSHRIPLARLKCLSEKRRLEMAARLGESGAARGVRKWCWRYQQHDPRVRKRTAALRITSR